MTVAVLNALHDLPELVVGDLVFQVAPPRQRRTIEIVVERDASLVIKAPPATTIERATSFITSKRQWVYRKLVEKDALLGPPVVKRFVEGEGFTYLGRSYRLTLPPKGTRVRLDRGRFHLPAEQVHQGVATMRRWYAEVGNKWLRKRIQPWAGRIGEEFVNVEVRDLGYRWGSARPSSGVPRINVHWATLQLPPASSTTSSFTNSPTSENRTTPPNSGRSSNASCPATRPTRPPSPPWARTSGSVL